MAAQHYRWTDLPNEAMSPSIARRYMTGDHVTIARFELAKGGIVNRHAHPNEQVTNVLSGSLEFRFPDGNVVVRAGEMVRIPGDLPHEVEVLEDAVAIDVFSPVRQDWIDKTDGYFKSKPW